MAGNLRLKSKKNYTSVCLNYSNLGPDDTPSQMPSKRTYADGSN